MTVPSSKVLLLRPEQTLTAFLTLSGPECPKIFFDGVERERSEGKVTIEHKNAAARTIADGVLCPA
jgi:hypothetical protein